MLTKVIDSQFSEKPRRSGADGVVKPSFLGGTRLAAEMVNPHATNFLNEMMRAGEGNTRVHGISAIEGSKLNNTTMRKAMVQQRAGLLVIAITTPGGETIYNPGTHHIITTGSILVVIGDPESLNKLDDIIKT